MVTNLLPRKEVAETGWSSEARRSGVSPACLGWEQTVEVWEGHPGRVAEHHALLCSVRLRVTAELLSAGTRESCAALFGRKGGTWKLCPVGGAEVDDLAQVCHQVWRAKWVYGEWGILLPG